MEAFNAEPNVREQRLEAYKDRYVKVVPKGDLVALRLEVGGELHHDDGSIVRLMPGDWVVEQPDGKLTGISMALFDKAFDVDDAGTEQYRAHQVQTGERKAPRQEAPVEEERPDPDTVKAQVLAAQEEANRRVKTWADAAFDAGLIDSEEQRAFIATNEFPPGLTVREENGEWVLSRGEGHDVGSLSEKEDAEKPTDWTEQNAAEIKRELTARGVKFKAADSKGKLIDLIERSEANLRDGGDGVVPYEAEQLPEPIVSTGADTPDTAAREPHPPESDPVVTDPTPPLPEDDGRRPGGETRTEEDGEVEGRHETEQKAFSEGQAG